jgi:hypothetical protein
VPDDPVLNDVDLDKTGLSFQLESFPTNGVLELEADGSIRYTPTPGYVGEDSFTYRAASRDPATFIMSGSAWRFLDNGANLGTLWTEVNFDDDGWDIGDAQLGYGDGDESTVVDFGDPAERHATTYFRKAFSVEDSSGVVSLEARVLRDDAAAIYLNGVEIYRDSNLAVDADHETYADGSVDDENAYVTFAIPLELLMSGENILAVEIHQAGPTDGDLSFDLELVGHVVSAPTTVSIDVLPPIFGDVNFDGVVDLTDLNLVRNNFGGDASEFLGDADGDGQIGLSDLNAVRNNFGDDISSPAAQTAAAPAATETRLAANSAVSNARQSLVAKGKAWDLALVDWLNTTERNKKTRL